MSDINIPSSTSPTTNFPFLDIPASLVEEMLSKTMQISNDLVSSFNKIKKKRHYFRSQLDRSEILGKDTEIKSHKILTSCGIDGSFAIERLLGTDLIAIATVGVEGLMSTYQKGKWNSPNHNVFINPERHDPENMIAARGLMIEMEINLAASAPYELIFLDGSLTTGLIHMYKAIDFIEKRKSVTANQIRDNYKNFLISYNKILASNDNRRQWIGIPKYTSRNDIGDLFEWPTDYDDRAILTLILNEGEYTIPKPFALQENWHKKLPTMDNVKHNDELEDLMMRVIDEIKGLHVIYYKPYKWSPAIRIEISSSVANDNNRLYALIQAIKSQCSIPSIMEPYPLYLADRMVKHIAPAIPAYKQVLTQSMTEFEKNDENISDIIFIMHSYRTESGM
ncbi:MAG TPA: DNA double-strand break repair nuclease NurA [Nitrososphaeraceae archaeon]|jgi:hypothetical protein